MNDLLCRTVLYRIIRNLTFLLQRTRSAFLFVLVFWGIVTGTFAQDVKVSLSAEGWTTKQILSQIEEQTDYLFVYNKDEIDVNRVVSLKVKDQPVLAVLHILFKGTSVIYKLSGHNISLVKKEKNVPQSLEQTGELIKGKVVDEMGMPVIGANITIKGTTNGTVTDLEGNFSLLVNSGDFLLCSYIGYSDNIIEVKGKTMLSIVLKENLKTLNEVVVVGYGVQQKINLTGSVTSLSGQAMEKRPLANAATMLQGLVPGLRVNSSAGTPGQEGVSFRIRGQGTFSGAGSNPLILINGVEGSISSLDPTMIESVSVLKDAASASIYGSRAANGVVLVTTKQGSKDGDNKSHLSYHGNIAFHSPTRMYDVVTNSVEYMELFNTAKLNSGMGGLYSNEAIEAYRNNVGSDQYPNFDWLDYMFNTAIVHNHNLSIAGNVGQERKTTYNIALTFVDQPGTMRGFKFQKYNSTINLTSDVTDFISVGTYVNVMYAKRVGPSNGQEDSFLSTLSQAPTYMPWLPDDGSGITYWTNTAYNIEKHNKNMPAMLAHNIAKRDQNCDINAQLWTDVKLLKGLHWYTKGAIRLQFGKAKDWNGQTFKLYNYHTRKSVATSDAVGLNVLDSRNLYANLHTYLKYDASIKGQRHQLGILAGYSQENSKGESTQAFRKDFAFDLPVLDAGSTENWRNGGGEAEWALMSLFGRINYSYRNRYLLEANIRYDGTSRIAIENRWGAFPSFSAGWRATEEKFVKNLHWKWLDSFKLRGSWGRLGNQNIPLYPYQAMISKVGDYAYSDENIVTGYHQVHYANRNIKWETTAITDIGFDLTLFRGLNVTFDWYHKSTTDILRGSQVSDLLGLGAPIVNHGKVRNRGIELSVNYSKIVERGFFEGLHYSVGGYVDRNRNKLVRFGADEISGLNLRREGSPFNEYYMLECIGIFADESEIANAPKQFNDNPEPGDLRYKDQNNDGVINNDDRIIMSGHFPKFEYGISGNLKWKNIDISFVGQGVYDKKYYTREWGVYPFVQGAAPTREYLKGMWTPEHPNNAKYVKLYFGNYGGTKNTRPNSHFLRDASYFRLKSLTIGYTLPTTFIRKVKMNSARVYFSGENLLTVTRFMGLDPERAGDGRASQYPQNKICSFGLNVEF